MKIDSSYESLMIMHGGAKLELLECQKYLVVIAQAKITVGLQSFAGVTWTLLTYIFFLAKEVAISNFKQ